MINTGQRWTIDAVESKPCSEGQRRKQDRRRTALLAAPMCVRVDAGAAIQRAALAAAVAVGAVRACTECFEMYQSQNWVKACVKYLRSLLRVHVQTENARHVQNQTSRH